MLEAKDCSAVHGQSKARQEKLYEGFSLSLKLRQ